MKRGEDADLPLVYAPPRTCSRKLKPAMAKRFMSDGPLFGWMLGCPACGFIEMHLHEQVGFVERAGTRELEGFTNPPACMFCRRTIRLSPDGQRLSAVAHEPNALPLP